MRTGTSKFKVLGVDPGLNITGYGCVEFAGTKATIVEAGAIKTKPRTDIPARINELHAELSSIIAELKPDLVAVEQIYAHYKHPRTAILMAHARGVLLLAASQNNLPVRNMPATNVKKSLTGNGHAGKQQVQRSVQAIFQLPAPPSPPDVADAIAIALAAGRKYIFEQ